MEDILSTYHKCTLSAIIRKLNVSRHILIQTFFLVLICGIRVQSLFTPFSYTIHIEPLVLSISFTSKIVAAMYTKTLKQLSTFDAAKPQKPKLHNKYNTTTISNFLSSEFSNGSSLYPALCNTAAVFYFPITDAYFSNGPQIAQGNYNPNNLPKTWICKLHINRATSNKCSRYVVCN
jgi:hypothetical protein